MSNNYIAPDGSLNFARGGPGEGCFNGVDAWFNATLDNAYEEAKVTDRPWPVLSPSMLNNECQRRTAYDYHLEREAWQRYQDCKRAGRLDEWKAEVKFPGRMLRLFRDGHMLEKAVIRDLERVGFYVIEETEEGKQYGFKTCFEGDWARFRGRIDGVLMKSPTAAVRTPCLLEVKSVNKKKMNEIRKSGVKAAKPEYYIQVQIYMFYMELQTNPAFWVGYCKDDSSYYVEMIDFDPETVNKVNEDVANVLAAKAPEEIVRGASSSSSPVCQFCAHKVRCWTQPASNKPADPIERPNWL